MRPPPPCPLPERLLPLRSSLSYSSEDIDSSTRGQRCRIPSLSLVPRTVAAHAGGHFDDGENMPGSLFVGAVHTPGLLKMGLSSLPGRTSSPGPSRYLKGSVRHIRAPRKGNEEYFISYRSPLVKKTGKKGKIKEKKKKEVSASRASGRCMLQPRYCLRNCRTNAVRPL